MNTTTEALDTETFLVTAATGRSGRRVLRHLENHQATVRAASRRSAPPLDWHDPSTWDAVLDGVTGVYLCYAPDVAAPEAPEVLGGFARRAADHGVTRAVLLSGRGGDAAVPTEETVRASGLDLTVVRCAWFAQNCTEHFLADQLRRGVVRIPAPAGAGEPFVDLEDVAELVARLLLRQVQTPEVVEATGPAGLTYRDLAAVAAEALDRAVEFRSISAEEFVRESVEHGMHPAEAEGIAWLYAHVVDASTAAPTPDLAMSLGRPATGLQDVLHRELLTDEKAAPATGSAV